MRCYHPIPAWRAQRRSPGGSWPVTFNFNEGLKDKPVDIPCGHCIGCRVNKAQTWTTRIMHESELHEHSAFITLTYDEANLPPHASLRPKDMVDFLKRLRKAAEPHHLRFFQVGEYGDRTGRPHHHLLLWGHRFADLRRHSEGKFPLDTSAELDRLWGHGFCYVGALTRESALYCAMYTTKRITGPKAAEHYGDRHPEYATMSRRPGIGSQWAKRWRSDIYPDGTITLAGGTKLPTPRLYDDHLKAENPTAHAELRQLRRAACARNKHDGRRLANKERIHTSRLSMKSPRTL